ncbi:hypothetical protein AAZX31_14G111800 [Glycine max]|uniref:Nucleolar 27S pre-rRNA processing Urb2/Npa2 C-terminal domain-containing protein n=2 Tax=Glycine subgen. Soja TaxID=1462606 RepID=A0A0R0GCU1_SOYBN|nr:uncharacterized protein LOC102664451 [Glycine max]XP_028200065.1 uncharacterized protein LOC114384565 [Glycine soja]KRH15847.1 hypothetical protein GLYMA_14G115300v4 [Glycine max]RZB68641.1 hypothetical protein D0Y65_038419 [Glycine soja]|eukprot:XP_006596095.1 uncharacterized protein LOC102664451 [Glycine max]
MNKVCFSSEEGVACASSLRRIYEEINKQKHIFGRQCSLFLSNYVWVYSGYGDHKRSGIRREVDESLRLGVDASIDACSRDDIQYLHTVFGELSTEIDNEGCRLIFIESNYYSHGKLCLCKFYTL